MIDLQAELEKRLRALYALALDFLSEEEARTLFCSVTKRRRGQRGPGRKPSAAPNREAERKRRARNPPLHFRIERELTREDIERIDQLYLGRMDAIISDKK